MTFTTMQQPQFEEFEITNTAHMSLTELAQATNATFEGYYNPVNHSAESFAAFCRQFSIDLAQSVRLQTRQDKQLVGLAMLGLRAARRGWCGGFGIIPAYRGQGLAERLVTGLVDRARELKLKTLQLEVMTPNERAFKTYQRAGFEVTRQLVVLSAPAPLSAVTPTSPTKPDFRVQQVSLVEGLRMAAWLEQTSGPDQLLQPCWQRGLSSLANFTDMRSVALYDNEQTLPRAVLLYRVNPTTGQLGLFNLSFGSGQKQAQVELIGQLLNAAAGDHAEQTTAPSFSVLNEPEDSPLLELLTTKFGFTQTLRQYELVLML